MQTTSQPKNFDPKLYWSAQIKLIGILGQLGVEAQPSERLPLFRMFRRLTLMLEKDPENVQAITTALGLVNWLTKARINGMEPPHEKDRYL